MVNEPRQGDVWWAEAEDKRRPVLIVTRDDAIPVLQQRLLIAPVTRTVRDIPTEIALGEDEGLSVPCAASFDNLQPINRRLLTRRAGALGVARRHEVCRALDALADC